MRSLAVVALCLVAVSAWVPAGFRKKVQERENAAGASGNTAGGRPSPFGRPMPSESGNGMGGGMRGGFGNERGMGGPEYPGKYGGKYGGDKYGGDKYGGDKYGGKYGGGSSGSYGRSGGRSMGGRGGGMGGMGGGMGGMGGMRGGIMGEIDMEEMMFEKFVFMKMMIMHTMHEKHEKMMKHGIKMHCECCPASELEKMKPKPNGGAPVPPAGSSSAEPNPMMPEKPMEPMCAAAEMKGCRCFPVHESPMGPDGKPMPMPEGGDPMGPEGKGDGKSDEEHYAMFKKMLKEKMYPEFEEMMEFYEKIHEMEEKEERNKPSPLSWIGSMHAKKHH